MFFLNDAVTSHICTLFLHDALPILNCLRSVHPLTMYVYTSSMNACARFQRDPRANSSSVGQEWAEGKIGRAHLNSSHANSSYAVFCLKKKRHTLINTTVLLNTAKLD